MEQLILHLVGDYVTQSDWMAQQKTSKYAPAFVHATVYSLPFLLLRPSWSAFAVILTTHFFIDRFRLAKYVVYAKNFVAPPAYLREVFELDKLHPQRVIYKVTQAKKYSWANCHTTGYPSQTPVWLATWLMIIADNTMHLAINFLSIKYF